MKKPLVSILVPVYGVDKYLDHFFNSLLEQSYENFQLILVNDCSPDTSGEIIEKYLDIDSRIFYINKEKNEGLWKAREDAYAIATGELIINLDPDDYISKYALEGLVNNMLINNLDICMMNIQFINEKGDNISNRGAKLHKEDFVFSDSNIKFLLGSLYASWSSMFRKQLLIENEYNFTKGEMELFSYNFYRGVIVGVSCNSIYFYRQRDSSSSSFSNATKSLSERYNYQFAKNRITEDLERDLDERSKKYYFLYRYQQLLKLILLSHVERGSNKELKRIIKFMKKQYSVSRRSIIKNIGLFDTQGKVVLFFSLLNAETFFLKLLRIKSS